MIVRLIGSIWLASLCLSAWGQADFREGYLVRGEGDTLRGLVDYGVSADHHLICRFKSDEGIRDYAPHELAGYGFQLDKYFQSRVLLLPDSSSRRVFVEVVVQGMVSLYRFYDDFYLGKGGDFLELTNPSQRVYVQGQYVTRRSRRYAQIANMLMADCEELRNSMDKLELNERSLTEAVEKYNRCKGSPYVTYKAAKPWVRVLAGLEAGFSYSTLSATHFSPFPTHLNGSYEPSKTYIVGVPLDVTSPRTSDRMSLALGVYYTNPKYYNYNTYTGGGVTQYNYVTIDVSQLKLPIGIKARLVKQGDWNVSLAGGFMNTLRLDSQTHWLNETESNGNVVFVEKDAILMGDYQGGLWAALEVGRNLGEKTKAFLSVRYESLGSLTDNYYNEYEVSTSVVYWHIMAGVKLK